jgi:hypothetical protein
MTDYDAQVKIGCLVKAERLRTPFHEGGGDATTGPGEYATTRMVLPLPGEGVHDSHLACPVCEQSLTIRRSSPGRVFLYLQWALLGTAAACILMAAAGILIFPRGTDPYPRTLGYAFAVVGFLGLFAAMLCPVLPANFLRGDLVSIRDDVCRRAGVPGHTGMRGHTILDVHISERHPAEVF